MKKVNQLFMLVALLAGLSSAAIAQTTASTSGHASARVITAIGIQNVSPINWGSLIPGSGGDATQDVSGIGPVTGPTPQPPVTTGGVIAIAQGSMDAIHTSPRGPATFYAYGEPNFTVAITLPAMMDLHRIGNPGDILHVDNFHHNNVGTATLVKLVPSDAVGVLFFVVGATVTVPAGSPRGWYDGDFQVSVAYN
ncbi:MAG: DUF4402 domain-containing protein [Ignavibacteriota bacterium]